MLALEQHPLEHHARFFERVVGLPVEVVALTRAGARGGAGQLGAGHHVFLHHHFGDEQQAA